MSIFGALYNGVTGLAAQSTAINNISNNIANAQTSGFKGTTTSFEALVLGSGQTFQPGGVVAKPSYTNDVAGSVTQTKINTNLAIQGNGFFSVSKITENGNTITVSPTQYYTRDGSFTLDQNRVLVNDAGFALNGYSYSSDTGLYAAQVTPIQVTSDIDSPVPTKNEYLKANLPTSPTSAIPATQLTVYDAVGAAHVVNLNWTPGQTTGTWGMAITAPGSSVAPVQSLLNTGFPAAITATSIKPNLVDRAQVTDVTLATAATSPATGINIGDTYTVTVNNNAYSLTITSTNISTYSNLTAVAQGLADKINGSSTSAGVTASVTKTGALELTASTAGTPFTLSTATTAGAITRHSAVAAVAQSAGTTTPEIRTATFTGTTINNDDVYTMTVNGVAVSVTVTPANYAGLTNISGVASQLAAKINANATLAAQVTATSSNGTVTVTEKANNTPMTLTTSSTDALGTANTMTSTTVVGNVTGSKPTENLSITGQPGDVGTTYSVTIRSPSASTANKIISTPAVDTTKVAHTSNTPAGASTAQSDVYTFAGSGYKAGDNFVAYINGTQVSVPITTANAATYNDGTGNAMAAAVQSAINANATINTTVGATVAGNVMTVTAAAVATPYQINVGNINGTLNTPAVYSYSFASASDPTASAATNVGQLFTVSLGSSTYNLQITAQNQSLYPTVAQAITQLATQVNADTGAPFKAVSDGAGTLTFTTNVNGANQTVPQPQPTPTSFSQVVSYTTTGSETSLAEIAADLAQAVNSTSNLPVQATASGGTISLTGSNDNTAFYVQIGPGSQIDTPGVTVGKTPGHIDLTFGGTLADGTAASAGTLSNITSSNVGTGNATVSANQSADQPAQVTFEVDYGYGPQRITLNLGEFGNNNGQNSSLTEYAGSVINVTSNNNDGAKAGTFQSIQINADGTVLANYDNGRQSTIAKIPVVLFNSPDALSQQTGNVFTETTDSGKARFNDTNTNGAGSIASSSLEGSNVDIANQFTSLIITQQTYSANTKVITTANTMLQAASQMVQ